MYTGHVAIALAARAARRDLPLWVMVVAAQACDWVEIVLARVGGRDEASLWSHAFPFVLLAAAGAAVIVGLWKRSSGAALVVLAVYLSHPIADLVTGYKPLWLGGPPLGLHFIDHPVSDLVVQGAVGVVGWAIYARSLRPQPARRVLVLAPLATLITLQAISDLFVYVRKPFRANPAPVVSLSNATPESDENHKRGAGQAN